MSKQDVVEKIITDIKYKFSFETIYPFTTENIDAYIDYFNLNNKSLLTTGSSSDQIINAILLGCKDITSIDICPLTEPYYYLKIASLLVLNRREYIEFLSKLSVFPFNKRFFNKIEDLLKSLNYESYELWNYIFNNLSKPEIYGLIRTDRNFYENDIILFNRYLHNDVEYEQVKKKIVNAEIKFIEGDITNIKLNREFDNIWLSNIGQYIREKYYNLVEKIEKDLSKSGKMLLMYSYFDEDFVFFQKMFKKYKQETIIIPNISSTEYEEHKALIYVKEN